MGQRTVIVGKTSSNEETTNINIFSPTAGGTEKNNVVNVMANVPTLPNSPYEISINNTNISQGMTTNNGDIGAYISGVKE